MSSYATTTIALGLLAAGVVYAQAPPAPNTTVTVQGCVAPIQRDGSLAAKAGATATPNTTGDEANNPNPTGVFMLLDATPASAPVVAAPEKAGRSGESVPPRRTSYSLTGREAELTKLNGKRVEVVGTVVPTIGNGLPARTDVMADGILRLRVSTVKTIAGNCSAAKK